MKIGGRQGGGMEEAGRRLGDRQVGSGLTPLSKIKKRNMEANEFMK